MDRALLPANGDIVFLRALNYRMCAIRGHIAGSDATSLTVLTARLEWWMAAESAIECTIIGGQGAATFGSRIQAQERRPHTGVIIEQPAGLQLLDRRRHRRCALQTEMTWAPLGADNTVGEERGGQTADISIEGLSFLTAVPPVDNGEFLAVGLNLGSESVTCLVSVVSVEALAEPIGGNLHRVRAHIAAITDTDRGAIDLYLRTQTQALL